MTRRVKETKKTNNLIVKIIIAVFIALLSVLVYNSFNGNGNVPQSSSESILNAQKIMKSDKSLRYWGIAVHKWNPNGSLRTMNRVFEKLGYKFVNASLGDDWDVLWSIEYPFKSTIRKRTELFKPMENYIISAEQRINHFPGIQFITNKRFLGIHTRSKYLPPLFDFPEDERRFRIYSIANPHAKYVEKNYNNRGVRVVTADEFDKKNPEKVYQVFLDKPFLIDGHAFDFGVYVLISSLSPTRIYRYEHEVFIRFCPKKYHPFDAKDLHKYVVDDDHLSVYDMPLFREPYTQYGYTFKMIFEGFLKEAGHDVEKLWMRVDDAITEVIMLNERKILQKVIKSIVL